MLDESSLRICPTTCYRFDGVQSYLYRAFDGVSWDASLLYHPLSWRILGMFNETTSVAKVCNDLAASTPFLASDVRDAISGLIECDILLNCNDDRFSTSPFYQLFLEDWPKNLRNSANFHLHTSRIDKINYSDASDAKTSDSDKMEEYVRDEPIPSNYHRALLSEPMYELSRDVPLERFEFHENGGAAFCHEYGFLVQDINIDTINFIINLTYAQTNTVQMISTGTHIRKAVPSGGARHPIETYIIANEVTGVQSGVYHYSVKNHRLDKIELSSHIERLLIEAVCVLPRTREKKLSFGFIHTCKFARSMFRYREPRSYRVMNYDLGHIHGNLSIGARLLGLNFSNSFSIPEDIVESSLLLNPFQESAMSSFSVFIQDKKNV